MLEADMTTEINKKRGRPSEPSEEARAKKPERRERREVRTAEELGGRCKPLQWGLGAQPLAGSRAELKKNWHF